MARSSAASGGRVLRQLRLAKGWTQAELGDAVGLSRDAIQHFENGRYGLGLEALVRVARVTRLPLEVLASRKQRELLGEIWELYLDEAEVE